MTNSLDSSALAAFASSMNSALSGPSVAKCTNSSCFQEHARRRRNLGLDAATETRSKIIESLVKISGRTGSSTTSDTLQSMADTALTSFSDPSQVRPDKLADAGSMLNSMLSNALDVANRDTVGATPGGVDADLARKVLSDSSNQVQNRLTSIERSSQVPPSFVESFSFEAVSLL